MRRIFLCVLIVCLCLAGFFSASAELGYTQNTYEIEDDVEANEEIQEGLVSLDFKDANLKDVLKVFSQQSGLNFVAAKSIEDRQITLYMNDVLVEDALNALLDSNNLGIYQSPGSNILIVRPKPTQPIETITRVYKIRYYFGNITPGATLTAASTGGEQSQGREQSFGWRPIINPLLSEYGKCVPYMNLLIITDVPERFKLIDEVISEIDKPVAEVMIEVELIETTADFLKDLGVKWGKEMARYYGPKRITSIPFTPWKNREYAEVSPILGKPLGADTDYGSYFSYGLMDATGLSWILEMLQTDTNTKFLAKPRILCQDREWAQLKVTADQIVSLTTRRNDDGSVDISVNRMEVGTILKLVPMINEEEGFVSLLIEPKISRPKESTFTSSEGTHFIDPQERSMRTVVMAKSGTTIVVGGFITTEDEEVKTKIPWLGDIPFFGALFRHTTSDRVDKELLIFITPKIVNPVQTMDYWHQQIETQKDAVIKDQKTVIIDALKEGDQSPAVSAGNDSAPKNAAVPKELSFREQEDLELNLTLNNPNLNVVDLVK
ncbi:MAG: hypothetical protein ABIG64_05575 [Candidatus Omnitrophota bacterium]